MTDERAHKQAVRRRMEQTGEKYTEAKRALLSPVGPLEPGEVRVLIVAWRLDDPAVQDDARFWLEVPEDAADLFEPSPGTIIPGGKPLAYWRSWRGVARGDEIELPNPCDRQKERISLARWRQEDPDRTYVTISFAQGGFHDPSPEDVDRLRAQQPAHSGGPRRAIAPTLSEDATRLKAERAELQLQYREALDRGDEQRMASLTPALEAKAAELARAAFPNYSRGWDFNKAIREHPNRFIFDWTTGY